MFSKIIDSKEIAQVEELLNKYSKIVITTHVSPDGDAIGSAMGLYHYLTDMGNDVTVVVPNQFPDFLAWIDCAERIRIYEKEAETVKRYIDEAELIFCLDFNDPSRTRFLGGFIEAAKAKKVMIDHHPEPSDFCDVTISYPEISSTCELVFRLICRMGDFEAISKTCAEAIYTGMMTDTGGFIYNSNNPEIYYIIGQLLSKGINKDQIYSNVYHNYSVDRYRLLGYTLSEKMKIYPEYNAALVYLTKEEQLRYNAKKGDTEGFANLPLNIKDISFAGFLREDSDLIKVSLRSQGDFPTNKFAAQCFNGGGHLNASGGEFTGTLEEAVALFERTLPEYAELLKKK